MRFSRILGLLPLLSGVRAASFTSCTEAEILTLERAIERATEKTWAAIDHLEANPNGSDLQTTWYGAFSQERYNRTLTGFKKFAPELATTFKYDCSCKGQDNIVTPGPCYGDIRVSSLYFNETLIPPVGQHRNQWTDTLRAIDYGYGADFCKETALEDPVTASKTAE
ncbi:hypothetical protein DHEL01_v204657 [Diaporthe helianthi]|uniref:Uncharacterized protein n=1 Tax=Diaporthe helianthi TaxID=158607 RepID=A0A2P5I385_DIAHE|nr:hypothetical protein DHEL01_v204657 [Diaporthe helianthi]